MSGLPLGDGRVWVIGDHEAKLKLRAELPGASIYDRVQGALMGSQLGFAERLAIALPATWMVNNKVTSPVLQVWMGAEAELEKVCSALSAREFAGVVERVAALLGVQSPALPLAALSKVLALLLPGQVPLLDDTAIAFLTGAIADPGNDKSEAGPEHLEASLRAFWACCDASELEPRELDRLLWFDGFGHRHFDGWVKLESGSSLEVRKLR